MMPTLTQSKHFLLAVMSVFSAGEAISRAQAPADALREMLATASRDASVEAEDTPAFHMEANFHIFDYRGQPSSSGTLTEDFLKPGVSKLTVHPADAASHAPAARNSIGGPPDPAGGSLMQRLLVGVLLHPGSSTEDLRTKPLTEMDEKLGAVPLRCITLGGSPPSQRPFLPAQVYCLSLDKPIIRMATVPYGLQAVYNRLSTFGGHTIAQQVTLQDKGHLRATLEITRLSPGTQLTAADVPSSEIGSEPNASQHTVSSDQATSHVASKPQPIYPEEAKRQHLSGLVFLHAVIGTDGAVQSLEVISTPSEALAQAAVSAVKQWRYKPFLSNGSPNEVDTVITVTFSFG